MRKFEIVKNKNKFFLLSVVIIVLGIVFYFINGLQLDVEYRGGTRILLKRTAKQMPTRQMLLLRRHLANRLQRRVLKPIIPKLKII